MAEEINWTDSRQRFLPPKRSIEPAIDIPISKATGLKVYQHDPRLLKLIIKWRGNKPLNSMEPDNFLQDPVKIEELKKVLSGSL